MVKNLLTLFLLFANAFFASAQLDSIQYHDGQMESQWGSSTVGDAFGCFVRVTPSSYPATLRGIRGYFRNADAGSTIKWKVYGDPSSSANGGVNVLYLSSFAVINPAAGGNANQQYDSYVDLTSSNIVINSGDVYVGAVQSTSYFGAGIDNAPNNAVAPDRQWQWMYIFNNNYWNTLSSQASSGQFGFTAFFTPLATGVNENHDEPPVNIFIEQESKMLHVQFPFNVENASLKIFDVTGRLMQEHNVFSLDNEINVQSLEAAIYIVSVIVNNHYISRRVQLF